MSALTMIEKLHFVHSHPSGTIAANEDIFNGDPASDVISLAEADGAIFTIVKNAGATGTATITVLSCDDTTPTNTTAIPFKYKRITSTDTQGTVTEATTAGFTTTAAADNLYIIEVRADQLSGTNKYVQLKCTEVADSPVDGAISAFLYSGRYSKFSSQVD